MDKKKGTPMERRTQEINNQYTPYMDELSSKDNQRRTVMEHLMKFGSITQREASRIYGIDRLASRIFELREDGVHIDTVNEDNAEGRGQHARYWLEEKESV